MSATETEGLDAWRVTALSHWPRDCTTGVNTTLAQLDSRGVFAELDYVHLEAAGAVRHAARTLTPDRVVLINGYKAMVHPNTAAVLRRAARLGCRVVPYWHETDWSVTRIDNDFPIGAARFRRLLRRLSPGQVTHWAAGGPVATGVARRLSASPASIRVVYNIVDLDAIQPAGPRHREHDAFHVAAAGRPVPLKGTRFFAELSRTPREIQGRPVRHHWIGGDAPPDLPEHRVRFEPFCGDLPGRLARVDALVCPSFHDAFNLVGVEALALDKPVFCRWPVGLAAFLPEAFVFASRAELWEKIEAYAAAPDRYPPGFFRAISESFTLSAFCARARLPQDSAPDLPPPATTRRRRLQSLAKDALAQLRRR